MKNIALLVSLCLFFFSKSWAQEPVFENNNLDVVKTYEVDLQQASLISIKPVLPQIVPIKKKYQYKISIVPISLQYPDPVIKPLAMDDAKSFDQYKHYLKLGYGTLNNAQGVWKSTWTDGDRYRLNFDADFMLLDNTQKVDFQKVLRSGADLNSYVRIGNNTELKIGLEGNTTQRYFFSDNTTLMPLRLGQRRVITTAAADVGISNISETATGINYNLGLRADRMFRTSGFDTAPHRFTIAGQVEKRASDNINLVIPVSFISHVEIPGDDKLFGGASLFEVSPTMHFQMKKVMVNAGVNFAKPNNEDGVIWPEIELAYGVWGNFIQVFAATHLQTSFNDFFTQLAINPWVEIPTMDIRSTLGKEYFGGLRGEANFISYQGELGYADMNNLLMYNNLFADDTKSYMASLYDEAKVFFVRGNVDFSITDKLEIGGIAQQNIYSLANQPTPWGLPSFMMDVHCNWKLLGEKLLVHGDLSLSDRISMTTINAAGDPITSKLNTRVDLSGRVEYWPLTKVGIHGYANNLLNNKYQRYAGLPTVGIHFGGGILVKF